ncbi:MAG: hypothetical protein HYZ84_07510 [Candidatus Omnitrophica bacterium]|nr:hypothetical protein [Candidatus Omnitrophota bacterium]
MHPENREKLERRVIQAAYAALKEQKYVSAIDVLLRIGWLMPSRLKDWRLGKVVCLEQVIQANLSKISYAMKFFRKWALEQGLKPSQTAYLMRTKGLRQELQFSKSGDPNIEAAYRTHYLSPELSEKKQARLQEKLNQTPELVVFWTRQDSECLKCKIELGSGSFLFMDQDQPFCMKCSGFDDLIYLPAGDAKVSRLAKNYSARYAVVVRFNRTRKRYERQGLLVEKQALEKAGKETSMVSSAPLESKF